MTKKKSRDLRNKEKKALVLKENKNRTPFILWGAAFALLAGAAFFWLKVVSVDPLEGARSVSMENPASRITYPAALFDDGKARHFHYRDRDITIRYFILKSKDGVIRAAFDACDVCWPTNKGYFQEGDVMVCRNCGQRFASVKVNEVKGGCNPSPLRRTVEGNRVILETADILEGKPYFNFAGQEGA